MGQPVTRLQISGQRFLTRRMEHALVRADARMLDDPLRAQSLSLVVGAVLAAIAVAVCAVIAVVRPGGTLGDARIVVVRESGAMFVRLDDVLHPVYNLASARLLLGSPEVPRVVAQRAIDHAERGARLGIPAAPEQIPTPLSADEAAWSVCDDDRGVTTVVAGPPATEGMTADRHVLVTPRGQSAAVTYLLHGGRRSRVDLRHPAVVRALRLDGVVPQPVSMELLAALPEAPAIEPPRIPGLGAPAPGALRNRTVGTVVTVAHAGTGSPRGAGDHFVVLADGLQRIGEVTADLIRFTDARAGAEIPAVSADIVGALPVVTSLPVATYPDRADVTTASVVCATWAPTAGGHGSRTELLTGPKLPPAPRPIVVAPGREVAVPPGRSLYVRAVGLTGGDHSGGSLFLVTDAAIMFGIRDADAAAALGLVGAGVPAPWPVLATVPRGPELSRDAATGR